MAVNCDTWNQLYAPQINDLVNPFMHVSETPKRLAPTHETLRELFLKSGNLCAFPSCGRIMMNADGVFIGQICHIEAAEKGGQRFNVKSTNEDRRHFRNLMLMCHEHHKVTDDEEAYPPWKLRELKRAHEVRFANPHRAMLEQLKDWTKANQASQAINLRKFDAVLKHDLSSEELKQSVGELQAYVVRFTSVPIETRDFLRAVVQRIFDMRNSGVVVSPGGVSSAIRSYDLKKALRLSDDDLKNALEALGSYGLGGVVEIDGEFGVTWGVAIYDLPSGWPLWSDLAQFCAVMERKLETFAIDLDFAQLDDSRVGSGV